MAGKAKALQKRWHTTFYVKSNKTSNSAKASFHSKKKREQEEIKRADIERQREIDESKNITFDTMYQTIYLPHYLNAKPEKTRKNEQSLYKNHIKDIIGNKKLSDISPIDCEKIKAAMTAKAPATINHALALVRQVFNVAKKANLFGADNPIGEVKKIKTDNRRIRFLTKDEAQKLLNETKSRSQQVYEISALSLYSGLRAGEIFKLKWADVDFREKKLSILDPKGVFNRFAYMTDTIFDMLLSKKDCDSTPDTYIFKRRDNDGKITDVSDCFRRAVEALKLNEGITDRRQKVVFHTLRHTYGSWLVQAGISLYEVQTLMGHSDIAMTQRYAHLAPDNFKKAIQVIENTANKIKMNV